MASAPLKIQRPNSPSPPELAKITDLDDYCLEKIFTHLDVPSLFNVAASNAWLRPAAQYIYKRKFGECMVSLTALKPCTCSHCESQIKLSDNDNVIIVLGLKASLEYLRCLGASVGILTIMYRLADGKWSECIGQYVKEYCSKSLHSLVLIEKTSHPLNFGDKSFVNVHDLMVINSDLTNQLAALPRWFPNLKTLKLNNVRMYDRSVDGPFQHLEVLAMDVNNGTRPNGFTKREAADLLALCPALVDLEVRVPAARQGMTLKTLTNIIKNNPALQWLVVTMERYWSDVKPADIQQFVSEHPDVMRISFPNFIFTAETAHTMIRQLTALKLLKFQIKNAAEFNDFVGQLDKKWKPLVYVDLLTNRCFVELFEQEQQ